MTAEKSEEPIHRASWIWKKQPFPDQYVCFRRRFIVNQPVENACFDVSVDTDYIASLNGVEIARGQFGDSAHSKTWDRFSIGSLRAGESVLAIFAFYKGEDFFDYEVGTAGVLACLHGDQEEILSDHHWRAATHSAFRSGQRARVTNQMGFTFDYDAQKERDWQTISFDDRDWEPVEIVQAGGAGSVFRELNRRPLPQLEIGDMVATRTVAQGSYIQWGQSELTAENMTQTALAFEVPSQVFANPELRDSFSTPSDENSVGKVEQYLGPPKNPGELLSDEHLILEVTPPREATHGRYILIDLKQETVGLLEFDIDSSAGAVLEIAHGEHLEDGRVRAFVGGRCFADRYVCREGRQRFQMPFRRLAARYLQVHISNYEHFKIHQFGLRKVAYPTQHKGSFVTDDRFATRLHHVSVHTLELCRHEHFEDCPWREQALYAYDSRIQALFGYYAFGDYDFPKVSFELLGNSANEEGYTALTAPGRSEVNIPIFSFAWVVALSEHNLFSGDLSLFHKYRGTIARLVEGTLSRRDEATGLYRPPAGLQHWHFYEWTPGLAGCIGRESLDGELHAAYNLHLREAFRAYLRLLSAIGETSLELEQQTRKLGMSIHRSFWNEEEGHYHSTLAADGKRSGLHELVQALALCEGIVPEGEKCRVMDRVISGNATRCSLSASFYLLKAAMQISPSSREYLSGRLSKIWEKMLFSGATSMWETENGANDFDFAGSLCHGWSAVPVWYHQAHVLGVTPLSTGFRKFQIRIFSDGHRQASGKIPTPHGDIHMQWKWTPQGLDVDVSGPAACQPLLKAFEDHPVALMRYNGAPLEISPLPRDL